jgi:DNA replication ATP-dependent helicase Dna2
MPSQILDDLIEATRQERKRIEEPINRSRYFMFGKAEERQDKNGYSVTFENVPERVIRDARWSGSRDTPSLFKVGDIFVEGTLDIRSKGINVSINSQDITRLNVDIEALKRITDIGIDYVMDNRDLTDHLLDFLEFRKRLDNQFLDPLIHNVRPILIKPIAKAIVYKDLNTSQKEAIEKALNQKVTFFWGPPGTGKTKTMGALAASLIQNGKRVLLTALSNMALDQLLLSTLERLQNASVNISIARLGSTMDERCRGFSRNAFNGTGFSAKRGGLRWGDHVKFASLVAGNFAMLAYPRAANPGQFDYVIADEVSMANIPSLAAASFFAKNGLVVGGDPQQLPPIYPEDAVEPNEWFRANIFDMAGVTQRTDPRAAFLDTQYRMQQEIGDLVSQMFYDGVLKTGTNSLPLLAGFGGRVVFIHSPGSVEMVGRTYFDTEEQRRYNEVHADSAARAALMALKHDVKPSEIGIIAPYNAQVVKTLQKVRELSLHERLNMQGLKVSTIHSFQGQERRVIIVDFSDDNIKPTRLTAKWELINVALSRAKEQLTMIGNRDYLLDDSYFSIGEIEVFQRMLNKARILAWK